MIAPCQPQPVQLYFDRHSQVVTAGGTAAFGVTVISRDSRACGWVYFEPASTLPQGWFTEFEPFGFDTVSSDGGMGILSAGVPGYALAVTAKNENFARGEAKIPGAVPSALRVRMKVRADERIESDATSTHFLILSCANADNLAVKFTFDGELEIQVGSEQ